MMRSVFSGLFVLFVSAGSGIPAFASPYSYVAVGNPNQIGGYAYALNNHGQVATTSLIRSYVATDTNGSFSEITIAGAHAGGIPGVVAQGMNDAGEVAGRFRLQGNPANQTSGFVRRTNGTIDVYNYPGLGSTSISDINNLGQMVGETRSDLSVFGVIRGFLYDSGAYSEISFPGSVLTRAYGINDSGDIVGQFQNADAVNRPFLLTSSGYEELALLNPPGGFQSALATGISDNGSIVGTYRDAMNVSRTWVRHANGSFMYPELPGAGWNINDAGQISGSFLDSSNGNLRTAYVASVPEPSSVVLVSFVCAMMLAIGRRARYQKMGA